MSSRKAALKKKLFCVESDVLEEPTPDPSTKAKPLLD
jgi:hypothetical protein